MITIQIFTPQRLFDILNNGLNDDADKRIKYFGYRAYDEITIVAAENDKMIGAAGIQRSPEKGRTVFWIKYLSIDPDYQGRKISHLIADAMFDYAKRHNFVLQRSNYTAMGRERLERLFTRLREKYRVEFIPPYDECDFQ
jgi:GNAT superfamily N-acetyltransferase